MPKIKLNRLSAALFLMLYGTAHANVATFGDLDELQSERFYYQAQAAAKAAKRAAQGEGGPEAGQNVIPAGTGQYQASDKLPVLVKVNGRKAVIDFGDGTTRSVSPGEMLPGGKFQVQSVSLNGVSVKRISDGKSFPLN